MSQSSEVRISAFRKLQQRIRLDPLPIRHVRHRLTKETLRGDGVAAFNVALLAFPQGMAYAFIAGLPIHYGIWGSAVACLVGSLFAGSRFITLGPTNATAVMLLSAFAALNVSEPEKLILLPLLLLIVGGLCIIGALLRIANLIQYISRTVVTGYITAAAVLIIANQVKNALGFSLEGTATTFFEILRSTIMHLPMTQWPSLVMSLLTLCVFMILHLKFRTLPNVAVTLIVMSVIGAALSRWVPGFTFEMLRPVSVSDWNLTLPRIELASISMLASPALAIAILCILEGTSIGKSLAARTGERLDANQEIFSVGMANIGCALFSGMPASGSLTRSVLNWTSGAKTTISGLLAGSFVAACAVLFGSLIRFIPSASLAVLVVCIGVSLINRHAIWIVVKTTRSDAIVFFTTLISGLLLPLDTAIYYGVGTSIVLFLRKAATPEMIEYGFTPEGELAELKENVQRANPEISIVHVEGNLFFGAAELFYDQLRRVFEDPNLKIVVLKMRNAHLLDATSVMALEELILYMQEHDRYLLVSEARKDTVRVFKRSGLLNTLGRDNIFPDVPSNHTLSTARALKHAKKILGGQRASVSVYYDRKKGHDSRDKPDQPASQEKASVTPPTA